MRIIPILLCSTILLTSCKKLMNTCQDCYLTKTWFGKTDTVDVYSSSFPFNYRKWQKCEADADTLEKHKFFNDEQYGCSCTTYNCE